MSREKERVGDLQKSYALGFNAGLEAARQIVLNCTCNGDICDDFCRCNELLNKLRALKEKKE